MIDRENLKLEFLNKNNLHKMERVKLKSDASFRTYERLKNPDSSFILMDAPPEKEQTVPFINMANFLRSSDFSAPEILAQDTDNGFLLLEDFGDHSFNNVLSGKSHLSSELDEEQIYEKAIDVLISLHKVSASSAIMSDYDDNLLLKESNLFLEWYVSVLNGEQIDQSVKKEFDLVLKHLFGLAKIFPNTTVLRDYHADNLMWLHDREGHRKVGLLDFQDAIIGSPVYDLVSLLEDLRRDVGEKTVEKMIQRYLKAFPQYSRKDFNTAYAVFGVQRNLKIVGFCARQATKYKNPHYLAMLPRVWKAIRNSLKHPLLFPLRTILHELLPTQIQ